MRINRLAGIALGAAPSMATAVPMASADTETVSSAAEFLVLQL
ncbi:hypothetical protein [Streptomyces sp. TE5632]